MRQPSPLAFALLCACCPLADRDAILGDLVEEHRALAAAHGDLRAGRWLWRQALQSVPALLALRLNRSLCGASGLALASGFAAVVAVQSVSAAGAGLVSDSAVPGAEPWCRAIGSVLAFACGGYAAARIGHRSSRYLPAVFGASCVAISTYFLWPVVAILRASGEAAILYHLLLLALIVPSVIAGAGFDQVRKPRSEIE